MASAPSLLPVGLFTLKPAEPGTSGLLWRGLKPDLQATMAAVNIEATCGCEASERSEGRCSSAAVLNRWAERCQASTGVMSHVFVVMGSWKDWIICQVWLWIFRSKFPRNSFSPRRGEWWRVWGSKYFSRLQSFFWAPLQHLELIKGCTPKTPPPIRNRKGIFFFKPSLQFLSTDTPCHQLLFHNDLTEKEWSSGTQSSGHHMLITALPLQIG